MSVLTLSTRTVNGFEKSLYDNEKSKLTVQKYLRDVRAFKLFLGDRPLNKSEVVSYKNYLTKNYSIASANSMLASLNSFFKFSNKLSLCIKQFKVQKKTFCPQEKELSRDEYVRLVNCAKQKNNERLSLLIQCICSTGIRVSELSFITVESAKKGECTVKCKGKTRTIFIVPALAKKLLSYAREHNLKSGCIFVSRNGKPLNRTNVWREMKSLCKQANVLPSKVFPHNLRHLFARTFYGIEKDIAKLADILGHSNVNTTRIYIVTSSVEHKRKMENMRLIL